jgi:hypothetical protein
MEGDIVLKSFTCVAVVSSLMGSALLVGCAGYTPIQIVAVPPPPIQIVAAPPPPVEVVQPAAPAVVVADGPVVQDPSVVLIDVEPAPDLRVYYYDPGYPPGCYFYGGYYYYGGYRYPHDVFINRYVNVNIRDHRFIDRRDNMERGRAIEAQHRTDFARTGGHPGGGPGHAAPAEQRKR